MSVWPLTMHDAGVEAQSSKGSSTGVSRALDRTFKIGMVLKGADGILEVVGGFLLLFLSPASIVHIVRTLTAHELSQDSHDVIARSILHTTSHLTQGTTLFGAVYLLTHGAAKIVLI